MTKHKLDEEVEDILQHYGIKGMKWGVMRTDAEIAGAADGEGAGGGGGEFEPEEESMFEEMGEMFDEAMDSTMDMFGDFAEKGKGLFGKLFSSSNSKGIKEANRNFKMERNLRREMVKQKDGINKSKDFPKSPGFKDRMMASIRSTITTRRDTGLRRNTQMETALKTEYRRQETKKKQGFKPKPIPKAPTRLERIKNKVDSKVNTPVEKFQKASRDLNRLADMNTGERLERRREGASKRYDARVTREKQEAAKKTGNAKRQISNAKSEKAASEKQKTVRDNNIAKRQIANSKSASATKRASDNAVDDVRLRKKVDVARSNNAANEKRRAEAKRKADKAAFLKRSLANERIRKSKTN